MSIDSIKPYAKAVAAFITPGAGALAVAMTEASPEGAHITGSEWLGALILCVVTAGAVYAVPNRDPQALHQSESVQPPEGEQDRGYWGGIRPRR